MSYQIAMGPRERKSPFFDSTVTDGATAMTIYNQMFMPVSYGNALAEYNRLMEGVSMWDVAAQRQVEIEGQDAERLVRYITPRDLKNCPVGKGNYVPICDHEGRLLNDPVVLRLEEQKFWLSISDSDILLWVRAIAKEGKYNVVVSEPDVSPLAIQGPKAVDVVADLFGDWIRDLKYFWFKETELDGIPLVVARSGWSKQGGYELYLCDGTRGPTLWDKIKEAGKPYEIGPGAPNYIERLESGLLSFGADTHPDSTPFEVGMGKFVDLDREDEFIGKHALTRLSKDGPKRKLVGVIFDGDPVTFNEHPWVARVNGTIAGTIRSVCHSPRRKSNIGFALLETQYSGIGTKLEFKGEGRSFKGEVVAQPLVDPKTSILT
jgi:glycine cleavage system aminomethyltransferase T